MAEQMWDDFSGWMVTLPPARPAAPDLRIVASVLSTAAREHACVLGSTAELIDLVHSNGFRHVTVIDHSNRCYERSQWFRRTSATESLVVADWRDALRRFPHAFDVVLSDFTLGNVPYESREEFVDVIAQSLRRDGVFVDRVLTNEAGYRSIASIRRRLEHAAPSLATLNRFFCEVVFTSELLRGRETIGLNDVLALSPRGFDVPTEVQPDSTWHWCLRRISALIPEQAIWYYGQDWSEVEKLFERRLTAHESVVDSNRQSPFYRRARIMTWHPS